MGWGLFTQRQIRAILRTSPKRRSQKSATPSSTKQQQKSRIWVITLVPIVASVVALANWRGRSPRRSLGKVVLVRMTNPRTSRSFLWGAVAASVALVAAMAALLIAYYASPAQAAGGSCSTTSGTTTCTFGPTGAEDTFVVPEGVSTIHVVATGAPGAVGNGGDTAGLGAQVSGDLPVAPGQTLYVNVGGAPTSDPNNCVEDVDCIGGFNGGGSSSLGGGGGGASDVRTVPRDQSVSLSYRLIVAGGGGGAGTDGSCPDTGGTGGDAGSDGGNGQACNSTSTPGSPGGNAGSLLAGGAGGDPGAQGEPGQSGVLGQGGNASDELAAGGGGGGLFGGGAGGQGSCDDDEGVNCGGSGGGGGGSNLVPPGGPAASIASGDPSVTISYQAGGVGEEPPPTEQPQTKEDCKKGGYKEYGFKNQGACIKAVNHPS